ncbi:hypothetical protein ACET3Z_031423 [Daucus carota]
MDSTPKFVKFLFDSDFDSDEIRIPPLFCTKIADYFPSHVKLLFQDGYHKWVPFSRSRSVFYDMHEVYDHFEIWRRQIIIFEYVKPFQFNVSILGVDLCELEYLPKPVIMGDGVSKFGHIPSCVETCVDEVDVPLAFVNRFGSNIPSSVDLIFNSSIRFVGDFIHKECKLTGLIQLCNMLGLPDLNKYVLLVFTYNGDKSFEINAYDSSMTADLGNADTFSSYLVTENTAHSFEIEVKPFHMLRYAHGVDIPAAFKRLTDMWGMKKVINAYKEDQCWSLEVRKRVGFKQPIILDGWLNFRDGLKLGVGDKLIFKQKGGNNTNFTVEVVKKFV